MYKTKILPGKERKNHSHFNFLASSHTFSFCIYILHPNQKSPELLNWLDEFNKKDQPKETLSDRMPKCASGTKSPDRNNFPFTVSKLQKESEARQHLFIKMEAYEKEPDEIKIPANNTSKQACQYLYSHQKEDYKLYLDRICNENQKGEE